MMAAAPALAAVSLPADGARFRVVGRTLDGHFLDLDSLRGKVVLVYYWNTNCPVCLDKMPELRANVAGWLNKPFALVMINTDKQRDAAVRYWQSVIATQPKSAVMGPILWRGQQGYMDGLSGEPAQWPVSVLVDTNGKVAAHWEGRIPAQAWDKIADLIP
jgi:thiol-disulfide isomerase/thioredoxin